MQVQLSRSYTEYVMPGTDRFRVSGSSTACAMARRRTGTGSSRVEKIGPEAPAAGANCAIVEKCKLCNLQILQVAQFTCEPLARSEVRLEGGEGRRRRPRTEAGPARVWDV